MELRSSQERRPPKRYHGDGIWSDCNWGDDSPPATPRRASHNTNLRQQVRPVHTIDSTHSLARENSAHSAASATSRTTSLNTSPADIELQPSKHKHPIFDMAKRLPAKSSAFDSDFALGSGPDAHHVKPAVFPSLDAVAPLAADSGDSHSLTMLVDDRASKNLTVRRTSYELLEKLWKCDSFPDSMEEREKKWYRDIKASIEVNEGHPKVCPSPHLRAHRESRSRGSPQARIHVLRQPQVDPCHVAQSDRHRRHRHFASSCHHILIRTISDTFLFALREPPPDHHRQHQDCDALEDDSSRR
jgi:hypothetical protein